MSENAFDGATTSTEITVEAKKETTTVTVEAGKKETTTVTVESDITSKADISEETTTVTVEIEGITESMTAKPGNSKFSIGEFIVGLLLGIIIVLVAIGLVKCCKGRSARGYQEF